MKKIIISILFCYPLLTFAQLCDSICGWTWNDTAWLQTSKQIFSYDSGDSLLSDELRFKTTYWDSLFSGGTRSICFYDQNHNRIKKISQVRQDTNWLNHSQVIYAYTFDNKLVSELFQIWSGSQWDNQSLISYMYNNSQQLIYKSNQEWINSAWSNVKQFFFMYDSNNNQTGFKHQVWQSGWVNYEEYYTTYDLNNNKIQVTNLNWDMAQQWDTIARQLYYYNQENKKMEYVEQIKASGSWTNSFHETYSYDSNGNNTLIVRQPWDASTANWGNYMRVYFMYDGGNNCETIIQQNWYDSGYKNIHKVEFNNDALGRHISSVSYNVSENEWVKDDSMYFYFSHPTTIGLKPQMPLNSSVFPNPSSGIFNIELFSEDSHLLVFTSKGNCIIDKTFKETGKKQIDLSGYPTGLYFLKVMTGKECSVTKIIVQ